MLPQFGSARTLFIIAALAALALAGCSGAAPPQYASPTNNAAPRPAVSVPALSEPAVAGQQAFNTTCVLCHGVNAAGTNQGPPLVHRIYEPGHHADFAFRNAVSQGVPAHHWNFGNMPPVPGVSEEQVEQIICYVRELQRANGIFAGDAAPTVC